MNWETKLTFLMAGFAPLLSQSVKADVFATLSLSYPQGCTREVTSRITTKIDNNDPDWNLVNNQLFHIQHGLLGAALVNGGKGVLTINTHPLPNDKWGAVDRIDYTPYAYSSTYCSETSTTYQLIYDSPPTLNVQSLYDKTCLPSPSYNPGGGGDTP